MDIKEIHKYFDKVVSSLGDYTASESEQKLIDRDLVGFMMQKLSRKRFRRKLTGDTKNKIRQKVLNSITQKKPIHFVIPFGGYKHYWNPSYPEPDWAEFFHFVWMAEYVAPILAVYKPGVILEYISEDLILNKMNNYPIEALENYSKRFKELVDWFNIKTPANFDIRYFRVSDRYSKDDIIKQV